MAQITDIRKNIIEAHVNIFSSRVLEIGALDSPTYNPEIHNIKFLDFTSRDELAKKGGSNPRYLEKNLVNVDYVCPTTAYSKYISECFDLVIANHVIEHVPDTIRWLDEIHSILSSEGYLFLSIPDKRYTFDIVRRNTTIIDLLRNFQDNVKKPNFYNILEHFYYHKSISAGDVWNNNYKDKLDVRRFELSDAINVAEKHARDEYADVHCHVFTADTFKELLKNLNEIDKLNFNLVYLDKPEFMTNEFHVILRKTSKNLPEENSRYWSFRDETDKSTADVLSGNEFDFLDFGCSDGGSLERYGKLFQVEGRGLGLDVDPKKVKLTKEKGFKAEVCDITNFQIDAKVKFCIMHHFLEHIPSVHDVDKIIRKAVSIVSDFVLIRQPFFDADPYLFSHGFKLYWSNWHGHPNNMTSLEFHNILMPMVSEGLINSFSLYGCGPIRSSEDSDIHNLDSKVDQHRWFKKKHTPKDIIEFTIPVYKEIVAIVDVSGNATVKIESLIQPLVKIFSENMATR